MHPSTDEAEAPRGEDASGSTRSIDQVTGPAGTLHDLGKGTSLPSLSFFIWKKGPDKQFSATFMDPHYYVDHRFAPLHPTPIKKVLPPGLIWKEGK